MRKAEAASSLAAALALVAATASAQGDRPVKKYKLQPLILEKDQLGTEPLVQAGRARMRNGDCAGALDAFDAALRTAIDPTVRRDRGLCHEKLGHPYPAIDDYRAYLTAEPDAADADGIRARLAKLEQETTGKSSASSSDEPDWNSGGAGAHGDSSADVHAGATVGNGASVSGGASADSSGDGSPPPHHVDKMDYVDRDDDPLSSPLRRGKGWALAPFFSERKWFSSGTSFGAAETWSESVGLQFRYSTGRAGSLLLEAGYEHFNSTDVDPFVVSGLTSQLAWEFRFPLDWEYDNQLILAPGIGYEYLVASLSGAGGSGASTSFNILVPRARIGYRRMLGDSTSLDLALTGGLAQALGDAGFASNSKTSELVGLDVALVWGL